MGKTSHTMRVPLLDLKAQHELLREELRAACDRVLDSQQFILGEDVRLLEAEVAHYCGTRHAVGCASGTDALLLALVALDVATGSPNFAGAARPTVFLSALGWSNSLDISLRGKMTADELRDFVGGLSSQKAPLFRASGQRADGQQLQGAPMTLPQVFQLLSEKVRADVYAPHLVDTLRVKRFLLITLSEFTGEDIGYYLSQRPGVKQMPVAARQVMHGILSGAPVAAAELTGIEKHQPGHRQFLLTRYNEADFAITYFDYGTLLFMQQTSVSGFQPSPKKTMKCHTSNLRNYLALTHALSWFYRATADTPDPKIAALRGHIKTDLEQLPTKFVNHFSINFHANYGPLKNL